jgi:hypothetical protein
MSQFKNNPNLPNLYYSLTNSLYFDGPIDDLCISLTRLGLPSATAIKIRK